jgi:hypothetical protein
MAEAVPLRRDLSVECDFVIVDRSWRLPNDLVVQPLATVAGFAQVVNRQVEANAPSSSDFPARFYDNLGGQEVQRAQLVVRAIQPPGRPWGIALAQGQFLK